MPPARRRHEKPATSSSSIRPIARARRHSALAALAETGWLKSGTIATVELANTEDMLPPAGFMTIDERRYGLAKILILRHAP